MALPNLTPEQRAEALEKATRARRRRAEVKSALKSREMTLSAVLERRSRGEDESHFAAGIASSCRREYSCCAHGRGAHRAFATCARTGAGAA